MQKIKAILDSRATWLLIAGFAGAFGEHAVGIVNAVGALVMAVL